MTIDATSLAGGMTIDASTADPTPGTEQGDGIRIFNIDDSDNGTDLDVTISGLTLSGGDAYDGGAILARENLVLMASTITGNHAIGNGGGVYATSIVSATGSGIINSDLL